MGNNSFKQRKSSNIACDVLDFFLFFSLFIFWQLDFLDQTLSWKFIHLSAAPGILFVKMTGMTIMGRLHVKTWATVCKSNLCQSLHIHGKVKISLLPFLRMRIKQKVGDNLVLVNPGGLDFSDGGCYRIKTKCCSNK